MQCVIPPRAGSTPKPGELRLWGGHIEGLRRRCGEAAGVELWAPTWPIDNALNTGTAHGHPDPLGAILRVGRSVAG